MIVILQFPLVTSGEIAGVLRPGIPVRADSALRTLRENGLGGVALSVVPRRAGAAHGRAVWYSSLMLEVARRHRWGDDDGARGVLEEANTLATTRAARFVADALGAASPKGSINELDASSGGALSRLAMLTESKRSQNASARLQRYFGVVVGAAGDLAVVETADGHKLGVPSPALERDHLPLGTFVTVDYERVDGRSSLTWVYPAFELASERHARVPGPPAQLADNERRRVDRDVLLIS